MIPEDSLNRLRSLEQELPYGDAKGILRNILYFLEQADIASAKALVKAHEHAFDGTHLEIVGWLNAHYMLPNPTDKADPNPCPFCMAITVYVDCVNDVYGTWEDGQFVTPPPEWYVECANCFAVGPLTGSSKDAIVLWNQAKLNSGESI